jgi:hypothetical protein
MVGKACTLASPSADTLRRVSVGIHTASVSAPGLMLPVMRRLLVVAGVLVFIAGIQLYVLTEQTARFFAWTVDPPLTAAFLGAAYWASGVLEWAAARQRLWPRARIAVPSVFVFTVLTLVATFLHLGRFHFDSQELITLSVTWAWLGIYIVVPVLLLYGLAWQRRIAAGDQPPDVPLARWVRLFFGAYAAALLAVGIGLFLVPEATAALWAWTLTPLTGRATGAWLIGLGLAAAQIVRENDVLRVRPALLSAITLAILEIVALLRYSSYVDWTRAQAWVYVIFVVALLVVSGSVARRSIAAE